MITQLRNETSESTETPINPAQFPDPISANRNGKIAKLCRPTREELNQRLQEGQSGPEILAWLNADDHVREVMDEHFEGKPINLQNLSEWRQGGYKEWQNMQPILNAAETLKRRGWALWDVHSERFGNELANVFAVQLFITLEKRLAEAANAKESWECLCEGLDQINKLRRTDHQAMRANIIEREWEHNGYRMPGRGLGMSLGGLSGGTARNVASDLDQLNAAREMFEYLMKAGPKSDPKSGSIKPNQTASNSAPQSDICKSPDSSAGHTQMAADGGLEGLAEVAGNLQAGAPVTGGSGSGFDTSRSEPDETAAIKPNQAGSNPAKVLKIKPAEPNAADPDNQTPEGLESSGEVVSGTGSAPVEVPLPNKCAETDSARRMLHLELIT